MRVVVGASGIPVEHVRAAPGRRRARARPAGTRAPRPSRRPLPAAFIFKHAAGSEVTAIAPGDRVVVPYNIACGTCFMCERGFQSQCETTQNRRFRKGAALFGYTHLYGGVPGGQAELLRLTGGRGVDLAIDAVGMESEGNALARTLQPLKVKPDILKALVHAFRCVRRGGTVSLAGVYVGLVPAIPLGEIFDRGIAIRIGQANVRRWVDDLLPLLSDDDPLAVEDLATHTVPLEEAPRMYGLFQRKLDGCIKVVLQP